MTCLDCHKFSMTIDEEIGTVPYCPKRDIVISDEFCLLDHSDCCVCDGRYDGGRDNGKK
jgi:hypothetical protein